MLVEQVFPQGPEMGFQMTEKIRLLPASPFHAQTTPGLLPSPVPGIQGQAPICGIEELICSDMVSHLILTATP